MTYRKICRSLHSFTHIRPLVRFLVFILLFHVAVNAKSHEETVDFVIVGAGIGGSVLAGELSNNFCVCLLEAGQDATDPLIPYPVYWPQLYFNADHDWSFWTKPLYNNPLFPSDGTINRLFAWPRGKMLGGSSNHNAVQWNWGGQFVYNNWQNNLGLTMWGYNDILPYLQQVEHVYGTLNGQQPSPLRGTSGPVPIRETNVQKPIDNEFLNFSRASIGSGGLGLATFSDINLTTVPGFAWGQNNVTDARTRVSAYDAYARPVLYKNNVSVKTGAYVTRVILDKNKRARGVEYVQKGQTKRIYASKEVILSGGVANSPKILMHSGIGPSNVLATTIPQPVPLRHNLPGVGKNVRDHIFTQIFYAVNKFPSPAYPGPDAPFSLSANFLEMDGFLSLTPGGTSLDYELVQILAPAILVSEIDTFNSFFQGSLPVPVGTRFVIAPSFLLTQPVSQGEIVISSNNPLDPPNIVPPYFIDENDIVNLRMAFKQVRTIMSQFTTWLQTSPTNLAGENIQILGEIFPGPNITTDSQIDIFLKSFSTPSTHQVGGCKMGADNDPMAVVDQKFKVMGIKGLRVVDGSVLPTPTVTRPQATIYAMSLRAADFITNDYLK